MGGDAKQIEFSNRYFSLNLFFLFCLWTAALWKTKPPIVSATQTLHQVQTPVIRASDFGPFPREGVKLVTALAGRASSARSSGKTKALEQCCIKIGKVNSSTINGHKSWRFTPPSSLFISLLGPHREREKESTEKILRNCLRRDVKNQFVPVVMGIFFLIFSLISPIKSCNYVIMYVWL